MSYAVYVYLGADRSQDKIAANELKWTGDWSGTAVYSAASYDAFFYAGKRFVTVVNSNGTITPYDILPNKQPNPFSLLVTYQSGNEPPFAAPASPDAIAYAIMLAEQGTALALAAYAAAAGFGTIATASAEVFGTLVYSFGGSACQVTTVDTGIKISTGTYTPGVELKVTLLPDGTLHPLTYGDFQWFDAPPPATITDKPILLRLLATSLDETGVFATASVGI